MEIEILDPISATVAKRVEVSGLVYKTQPSITPPLH